MLYGMAMPSVRLLWLTWLAGGQVACWLPLALLTLPALPAAWLTVGKARMAASGAVLDLWWMFYAWVRDDLRFPLTAFKGIHRLRNQLRKRPRRVVDA